MPESIAMKNRLRRWRKFFSRLFLLAAPFAAVAGLFLFCSLIFQQDTNPSIEYDDDEAKELSALRSFDNDLDAVPIPVIDVDYSRGNETSWRPKGEAPIIRELVEQGKLPPVEQRVPKEPLVLKGVDGIGKYGGAWIEAIWSEGRFNSIDQTHSYSTLLRFSPRGLPVAPHIAKSYEHSADNRVFTIHLRKGMKWSDGHPFTADDIMYWYEAEVIAPIFAGGSPSGETIRHVGGDGIVSKIDQYTVRVEFEKPHGLFLIELASGNSRHLTNSPKHYLERFHPTRGDQDLIQETMKALRVPSPMALYNRIKRPDNPQHPRLWPWIYASYTPSGPWGFVRNPYYFAVDTEGNQLPYFDKLHWELKSRDLLGVAAANGEFNLQTTALTFSQYTLLMSQRERWGYEIRHWEPSSRSTLVIQPNLNRKVLPEQPTSGYKKQLLNERLFRRGLSLAINRDAIIDTAFAGVGEKSQVEPGRSSPFHEPKLKNSFIEYDPERASDLLDSIGFSNRDREGFRAGPNGERIEFYIHCAEIVDSNALQMVIDDWATIGVRARLRMRSQRLWRTEVSGLQHDISAALSFAEYIPTLNPRMFLPGSDWSDYARGFAIWYESGGMSGNPEADKPGAIEPPLDHPLRKAMELFDQSRMSLSLEDQVETFREILLIAAENTWTINIATAPPYLALVGNDIRNVPELALAGDDIRTPGNLYMETWYMEESNLTERANLQLQRQILEPTPLPGLEGKAINGAAATSSNGSSRALIGKLIVVMIIGSLLLFLILAALRHPFIAKRLVIMVPTMVIISILSFIIIQLPPGDYLTTLIISLEEEGGEASEQQLQEFKDLFYLEDPAYKQYLRWSGLYWFVSFKPEDTGLLQGNLGRSMATQKPVAELVGDRVLLTFLVSIGTIIFTWAFAIPVGIISAVRQYSAFDYISTLIGFIGMSIPNFLLAILLMYASAELFDFSASGLFSPEFSAQPGWSWPKFVDLMKHIWVPVLVLGTGGTASMIRIMRGNLLDELKKPYVQTARAKGVRPVKLIMKYPVRLGLNPFISGIGSLFPQLVSGGAITAIILSLPTVGPLMLDAFRSEDMYLAGSMLMLLSFLGVCGTLVSDLLLLVLDPRIRMEKGGSK